MNNCAGKAKAKINFSFGDGYKDSIVTSQPPIDVKTELERTKITYGSAWIHPPNHPEQFDLVDGRVTWDGNCTRKPDGNYYAVLSNGFQPVFSGGTCSVSFDYLPCEITISDSNGVIYKKQGSCQISHTIQCDDECPPGYCKCKCVKYPGYCCYDNSGNPFEG